MLVKDGDLYVSAVEGHIVARFGSARGDVKGGQIGVTPNVELDEKTGLARFTGMKWDLEEVVRIPRDDYVAHLKAYDEAIRAGSLRLRKAEEFKAQRDKVDAEEKKMLEEQAAAAKKAEDAAKKQAEEAEKAAAAAKKKE